jgi:hypothetical protein
MWTGADEAMGVVSVYQGTRDVALVDARSAPFMYTAASR